MGEHVVIPERFRGPPSSGHGGYSAAMAAQFIDGPAEATLRRPPPLETPMEVVRPGDGTVQLTDGVGAIVEARSAELEIEVPEPVTLEQAHAATARSPLLDHHPFASCFVCGTEREPGEGIRLFAGPVEGRRLFAAPWVPDDWLAAGGAVLPEFVWSVLDCPSGNVTFLWTDVGTSVLARFAAKLVGPVEVGRPHVAIGWPIGRERRKLETGSAIFTAEGGLCAYARALWIELREQEAEIEGTGAS